MLYKKVSILYISCFVVCKVSNGDRVKFSGSILREKSLAIYFEDSQFRRNRTYYFIVSKLYVDKRS